MNHIKLSTCVSQYNEMWDKNVHGITVSMTILKALFSGEIVCDIPLRAQFPEY